MRFLLVVPALMLTLVVPARGQEADKLETALFRTAPQLLKILEKKEVKNVGVIKFLVARGEGRAVDNAGVINRNLADRLETALLLALPNDKMGVIAQATDEAANHNVMTHLDVPGRRSFFDHQYTRAWGNADPIDADYFLTGTAAISADLKTIKVKVQGFGKDGKLDELLEFRAAVDSRLMTEGGYSYVVPADKYDNLARGRPEAQRHQQIIESTPKQDKVEPLVVNEPAFPDLKEAPIDVMVMYNNSPVKIENGRVPEPTAETKIKFVVKNKTDKTLGVVLKINGENSVFRERSEGLLCHKWILAPKGEVTVTGFQESFEKENKFKVLPPRQSRENEINYGSNAGTFQIAVFTGSMSEQEPKVEQVVSREEQSVAAIARGNPSVGKRRPGTLVSLQADLRGREKLNNEGGRGMIVADEVGTKREVKKVYFQPTLDLPVALLTIRYYQPNKAND